MSQSQVSNNRLDAALQLYSEKITRYLELSELDNAVFAVYNVAILLGHYYTQVHKRLAGVHKDMHPEQLKILANAYKITKMQYVCAVAKTVAPFILFASASFPVGAGVASKSIGKGAEAVSGLIGTKQQGGSSMASQDLEKTSTHIRDHGQAENQAQQQHERLAQQLNSFSEQFFASRRQIVQAA